MKRLQKFAFLFTLLASLASSSTFAAIERFQVVNPMLVRGGQPTTREDFEYLKRQGIKTVITFRTTPEGLNWEKGIVESLGMKWINHPINGMSYPDERQMFQILMDVRNPAHFPVFVHCHAGKDRTGLVVGLYRVYFEHWPRERAYEEMIRIGFEPGLEGLRKYFWDHTPVVR